MGDGHGGLAVAVVELCERTVATLPDGPIARQVDDIRARLAEPLRVAVGGRIKAGKSTLVNALLGRRIAATAVGECTKVVAWYRHDAQERIDVHPRDGQPWALTPTLDGGLPDELGAPAEAISHVTVTLASRRRLGGLTLIDTPGLLSANRQYSAGTERALLMSVDDDSQAAVGMADALIYLMPHPGDADREFLESFRGLYPDEEFSAVSVIGVLSKVDRLTTRPGRDDPWPNARRVAANYARKLRRSLTTIVPVAGLLAETASGDAFTEREALDLCRLAELDASERAAALESVSNFRTLPEIPLPSERRENLLRFLDLYGLREGLRLVDTGRRSATALLCGLRELSGIDELQRAVDETFLTRADPMRAARALRDLERLTYRDGEGCEAALRALRDGIERVRLAPGMRVLAEVAVLRGLATGTIVLPPDREREALRVLTGASAAAKLGIDAAADPEAIATAARLQSTVWRRAQNDPGASTAEARVARVLAASLDPLWVDGFAGGEDEPAQPVERQEARR